MIYTVASRFIPGGEFLPQGSFYTGAIALTLLHGVSYHRAKSLFEPLSNPRRRKNGREETVENLEESQEAAHRQATQEDADSS
jgi:hypothetical protein